MDVARALALLFLAGCSTNGSTSLDYWSVPEGDKIVVTGVLHEYGPNHCVFHPEDLPDTAWTFLNTTRPIDWNRGCHFKQPVFAKVTCTGVLSGGFFFSTELHEYQRIPKPTWE